MDILVSSNLERLLYLELDGDTEAVSSLMTSLKTEGAYQVSPALLKRLQEHFSEAYSASLS